MRLRRWKPWATTPIPPCMVAHCGRCKRRKVVEYELLPEEVKRLLLLYRWKTGVCLPCVDELAEKAGVRYHPDILKRRRWSDLTPEGRGAAGDDKPII
jgi:hypothetical protein